MLYDEGAKISICVPSTAPTTWGIAQSVNSWNDVVARVVSNARTGNLINVGAKLNNVIYSILEYFDNGRFSDTKNFTDRPVQVPCRKSSYNNG